MPRMPRVVIPEYPHHIVNRGNRRQDVFFQETDYQYYLEMLSLFSRIYEVQIVSYCLMTNHFHLIAIPPDENSMSQMMVDVQRAYTRMINFREGWRGCLWHGKYFSCPMDEKHTVETARYIELNPVKAKMVNHFGDYPYSSAGFHLGKCLHDPVMRDPYIDFTAQEWRNFVEDGIKDEKDLSALIETRVQSGRPLGGDSFIEKLERLTGRSLRPRKSGPNKHSKV
ncbi:MAG: transposase [Deltaproteobacteria bacterium]|nr:transposase [Deltaproteobacteria bacterium]